jgi:hypothetical protein
MKTTALRNRLLLGSVVLALSVAPVLANASSTDDGTLTAGSVVQSCFPPGTGTYNLVGFINGSLGSYSPTGLTGGDTVWSIFDDDPATCGASSSVFSASGFTSNPGSSWLVSVTCNGVERTGSSAIGYSYASATGVAAWTFDGHFGFANGNQVACAITHN